MNVTYVLRGNIVHSKADLLVNTVNCVGVAGAGVAAAFRAWRPEIIPEYVRACRIGIITPGSCTLFPLPDGRLWAAMATKDHWRDPSRYEWVESGLVELKAKAAEAGVRSIALPPPGCGLGKLDWKRVHPMVIEHLGGFDLEIYGERVGPEPQGSLFADMEASP